MTRERVLYIAAQGLSILLYPLWMPTFGMGIFCVALAHQTSALMPLYYTMLMLSTFVITALIPMLTLLWMRRKGYISDLYIEDPQQRTLPYYITATCYAIWLSVLSHLLHAPIVVCMIVFGALISTLLVCFINRYWKISAHLSGIGGLIGGVAAYHYTIATMPSLLMGIILLTLALLLMYARIYLRAHTPLQVVAGFLLAICCTFLPNMIITYVITH